MRVTLIAPLLLLLAAAAPPAERARHALDRLAFGPAPGEMAAVKREGFENYLQAQLRDGPEPPALAAKLAAIEAVNLTPDQLFDRYGRPETQQQKQAANQVLAGAQEARLLRAMGSPHQLREVMVDFWFNHFNVFSGKGPIKLWAGAYEAQAIRPFALGRFRDLLGATAHHPAMLFYLDQWQSAGQRGKNSGLNENYARELMELHTLGVDGGYAQQDVIELARILTGWGFNDRPAVTRGGYTFHFEPKRHDQGTKTLLGQTFKPGRDDEGERALDLLAAHPATARHLARKLAVYFVADDPPPALVDGVAAAFQSSQGDVRKTLDALFHRPEFWDARYRNAKFKTPYRFAVSAARAVGPEGMPTNRLVNQLRQFGQPIYGCPTPDGYKDTQGAWLSPEAMTRRAGFAVAIGTGRLGAPGATPVDPGLLARTLGHPFGPTSREAIATAPPRLRPALMLGSPEFNRR
ncbi:MAG: hypothetical protein JWM80_5677 [Cyanobacteria bacterium RYN_339]|nr:hypothetical protein [Cyanobacteria bacterium RYN_339]